MLRVIASGHELNLAHPPRPADPKTEWAPAWAAKTRVKSAAALIPGTDGTPAGRSSAAQSEWPPPGSSDAPAPDKTDATPKPMDLLHGVLGR